MSDVLRLKDTKQHDPRIDEWLDQQSGDLGIIARELVRIIRHIAVGGTETMRDGSPVTCIDAAPFFYVTMQPDHLSVGFFQGADLPDPHGLLTGTSKTMRHIRLRPRERMNGQAIIDLVQSAYDDMSVRAAGTLH